MKKNGFTLIELLAVIVILAIIALIATPIILGIINDAREKANERSVELYASAVRNGIAAHQLTNANPPTSFEQLNIQYDGDVKCTVQELYEDGSFYLEGCKVNDGDKEYSYGIKKESTVAKVCTIEKQDESKYSVGDIVTCELGETTDKFYVIADAELTSNTIKMLTEKNIHTTEYRQKDNAGTSTFSSTNYWSSETTYPADVYDERNDKIKPIVDEYVSYLNVKLNNAKGSLLTYNEIKQLGCDENKHTCGPNVWSEALENPAPSWVYSTTYWLGSVNNNSVWKVESGGYFGRESYDFYFGYGVRPVITISTSELG